MEVSMSAFDIFAKTPFDHLAAELLQKLDREITGQEANYMVPTEIFRFRWKALQAALCQNAGPHAHYQHFHAHPGVRSRHVRPQRRPPAGWRSRSTCC